MLQGESSKEQVLCAGGEVATEGRVGVARIANNVRAGRSLPWQLSRWQVAKRPQTTTFRLFGVNVTAKSDPARLDF